MAFYHATQDATYDGQGSLLPTPPNSATTSQFLFLSSPSSTAVKSHYRPFSQYQLLTPPNSASLLPEEKSRTLKVKRDRSSNRPVSMGFKIYKEKKEKEKGKEKEKEKDSQIDTHDHIMTKYFKSSGSKSLRKKRSVAKLLMLAASDAPQMTVIPRSPTGTIHNIEEPIPFPRPRVPAEEDDMEEDRDYTYQAAMENPTLVVSTKYRTRNRWAIKNKMKMHPYGSDAVYMQSYENIPLDNDRHFDILLRRLNPNGSPSFYDYTKNGERTPTSALDLACGQGHWVLQAAAMWPNAQIVGFDLVDVALPQAYERENITIVRGNFLHYALPFPSQSFDFVRIANASLAIPYDKWEFVLCEVQRVLTRGGRLEVIDDQIFFPYASSSMTQDSRVHSSGGFTESTGDVTLANHLPSTGGGDASRIERGDVPTGADATLDIDDHKTDNGDVDVDASSSISHHDDPEKKPHVHKELSNRSGGHHRRASSSGLTGFSPSGPRPNARPLSMSGFNWKKRLGDDGILVLQAISSASESETEDAEDEHDDEDEDVFLEMDSTTRLESDVKRISLHAVSVTGPRQRPMSMSGLWWKQRLNASLWVDDDEKQVVQLIGEENEEEIGGRKEFRMSLSSSESSLESMTSSSSTSSIPEPPTPPEFLFGSLPEIRPLNIEKKEEAQRVSTKPVRPLPSPPNEEEKVEAEKEDEVTVETMESEEEVSTTPTPHDGIEFSVTTPEGEAEHQLQLPPVDKSLPPTPMTTPSIADPDQTITESPLFPDQNWSEDVAKSKEVESIFTQMLEERYGVPTKPHTFLESVLESVFGEGKAGRVKSMHLMLAPEELAEYAAPDSSAKKESKIRWSDDTLVEKEKDKKMRGLPFDWDKKEKRQRARAQSTSSTISGDALPDTISAKAAMRLGITATQTKSRPSTSSGTTSTRPSWESSDGEEEEVEEEKEGVENAKHENISSSKQSLKQSPGLLLWPSTFIPMSPTELEMHACKNVHMLLGCKPALAEWVGAFVDQDGKRIVSDNEFEDSIWDYECFRRKRFNWPQNTYETDMESTNEPAHSLYGKNVEVPCTPKSARSSSEETPSESLGVSSELLLGGLYSKEDLTSVRTIRVYEAVKSWRQTSSDGHGSASGHGSPESPSTTP